MQYRWVVYISNVLRFLATKLDNDDVLLYYKNSFKESKTYFILLKWKAALGILK